MSSDKPDRVIESGVAVPPEPTAEPDAEPTHVDATAEELTGEASVATDASRPSHGPVARLLLPALLAALLVVAAGFAIWAYVTEYRPDQQTNAAVSTSVVKAASDGAVAMLSYAPQTMDKDFAAAKSHLTGDFLNYYAKFTSDVVSRAVKEKSVETHAVVAQAAIENLQPDSAVVLAFINQTTVSKVNPDGAFAQSAVKIGMKKVDGAWLIATFDTV